MSDKVPKIRDEKLLGFGLRTTAVTATATLTDLETLMGKALLEANQNITLQNKTGVTVYITGDPDQTKTEGLELGNNEKVSFNCTETFMQNSASLGNRPTGYGFYVATASGTGTLKIVEMA